MAAACAGRDREGAALELRGSGHGRRGAEGSVGGPWPGAPLAAGYRDVSSGGKALSCAFWAWALLCVCFRF